MQCGHLGLHWRDTQAALSARNGYLRRSQGSQYSPFVAREQVGEDRLSALIEPIDATEPRSRSPARAGLLRWCELYLALTTLTHHRVMRTRDNMSPMIGGLRRKHGLLAAYLKATDKIDWRALQRPVAIGEPPRPVNVEAHQVPTEAQLPEVAPQTSPFVFRRGVDRVVLMLPPKPRDAILPRAG
jgi:hypothetical protein